MTSDVSQREVDDVYRELYKHTPGLKLVYVTPEKVAKSVKIKLLLSQIFHLTIFQDQLAQVLKNLYDRKLLARFVIDECHCVSEWGKEKRSELVLRKNEYKIHFSISMFDFRSRFSS